MPPQGARVLDALIERLYNALARGAAINCYPGNSRQRIDFSLLGKLAGDQPPSALLQALLSPDEKVALKPDIENLPPKPAADADPEPAPQRRKREQMEQRARILRKLSVIASDADSYHKDTGSYVLYVGYPLLSIPQAARRTRGGPARILAPLAFVPVGIKVSQGARPSLRLTCMEKGADRVIPNAALKTWVERQLEAPYPDDLFEDEEGTDPAREVQEITEHVAEAMGIADPPDLTDWPIEPVPELSDLPPNPAILPCAVLGLYHLRNQSIIRDMEELQGMPALPDTVAPFVSLSESLIDLGENAYEGEVAPDTTAMPAASDEYLVDLADPCQRRAVVRARNTRGLVVHGPPGTGKSQTITNMIGDFLARGQRVLLVCEKRTALDVVKYRLDAKGLGHLCAVVHDAQRDRTALYKGIRDDLEMLTDLQPPADAERPLARANKEIDRVLGELREAFTDLAARDERSGLGLQDLVGHWLATGAEQPKDEELAAVDLDDLLSREGEVRGLYGRLTEADFDDNAWRGRCALSLDDFLAADPERSRKALDRCIELARRLEAKETADLPTFEVAKPLADQREAYRWVADHLKGAAKEVPENLRRTVAEMPEAKLRDLRRDLEDLGPARALAGRPPAADLALAYQASPMTPDDVARASTALSTYLVECHGALGFLKFGPKRAAGKVLAPLGLRLSPENAEKAKAFLETIHGKNLLRAFVQRRLPQADPSDGRLLTQVEHLERLISLRLEVGKRAPAMASLAQAAIPSTEKSLETAERLERAVSQIDGIEACDKALGASGLLNETARDSFRQKLYHHRPIADDLGKLKEDLERLEPLLRFEEESSHLSPALNRALKACADDGLDPMAAWNRVVSSVYYATAKALVAASKGLTRFDPSRIEGNFARLAELEAEKRGLVAQQIAAQWAKRQKDRLLATGGSRLNSTGADLRRRLMLRGKNASRIREMVYSGRGVEGGDPLFDMRPVWMTSPETAAQIFPLEPFFDAVIFDEASQCRLEEGLPVLVRGRNIVIAGDTKQLPPTSFFQAAPISSTDALELESANEDELFQSQQAEIEDLLSASLNIEIEQSYLDVHYRSASPDLIAFSNEAFYNSRLQAIPGHPNNRRLEPALQLHNADGVVENRQNEIEADRVVELVKGLLRREDPPSIGIVSFNLPQRDLIEEKLNAAAEDDTEFRAALAASRDRMGSGSFEGLFVKNLENVQGDERDYIIISTTFGPNAQGKFYRRFGPLGMAGGERRLNVIVTRARLQVDLVTSIPATVYRSAASEKVPEGKRPNGAWYLMRYLALAESLQSLYAHRDRQRLEELEAGAPPWDPEEGPEIAPAPKTHEQALEPAIERWPTRAPSSLGEALAKRLLAERKRGTMLYYGNEGFAVDMALTHPQRPENVTVGVLIDGTRYARAQDPVEWDAFRRGILEGQGWDLQRVWSPRFLRDPKGTVRALLKASGKYEEESPRMGTEAEPDGGE